MVKMGGLGIPVVWIPRNLQGLSSSMIQVTTNDGHFRMNLVLWWFLSTERSDSRERILVAWKPWRPRRRKNNTARRNGLALGSHGLFDSLTCFSKHFFNLSTATIHDNRKGPVARKKNNHNKKRDEFPIHVILQISNGTYYFCWWPFPIAAPTSHALIPKPTTSIETRKSTKAQMESAN